jgi:hypothetical protein
MNRCEAFLRLYRSGLGDEERNALRMRFKNAPNPLTKHSPDQMVESSTRALRSASALLRGPPPLTAGAPEMLVPGHRNR